MKYRRTQKQEAFCLKYVELAKAKEAAIAAGYSPKTAEAIASHNLKRPLVLARIEELRKLAEDATIATVVERKQILSQIARGRIGNLLDESQRIKQGEPLTDASIQEVATEEITIGRGENAKLAQVTKIKLHNPIQAIDLLNKMDKLYGESAAINVDNRTVNIIVNSEKGREITERLLAGERTGGDKDH